MLRLVLFWDRSSALLDALESLVDQRIAHYQRTSLLVFKLLMQQIHLLSLLLLLFSALLFKHVLGFLTYCFLGILVQHGQHRVDSGHHILLLIVLALPCFQ